MGKDDISFVIYKDYYSLAEGPPFARHGLGAEGADEAGRVTGVPVSTLKRYKSKNRIKTNR